MSLWFYQFLTSVESVQWYWYCLRGGILHAYICSWTGCMYYHRSNTVTSQMSACLLPLPTPKSTITPIPPLSSFSSKISPWALGRPTSACAVRMYFVFVLVWFWQCFDWFVSLFLFLRFYVRVQDRWWLLGPADGFWWPAARSWSSKYFIFIFTQVQKKTEHHTWHILW